MTCGRDDSPGYTCAGGYPKGRSGCGQHFGSLDAFDQHFVKTGHPDPDDERCADHAEMEAMGYHLSDNRVWKTPMDEARLARLRGGVSQSELLAVLAAEGFREAGS